MSNDEQAIRELVSTWLAASQAGDNETVLGLMTDDVVFLLPGRPPLRGKAAYAAAAASMPPGMTMEGHSEIQEISVSGDQAFMWTFLAVTATPAGGRPVARAGNTLTVFRKVDGKWLLARDANMLTVVAG
jgi:uncharacterized protein (TIGR02246 family)